MIVPPAPAEGGGWRALVYLADDHGLTPYERLALYDLAGRIDPKTRTWQPVCVTDWAGALGLTYRRLQTAIDGLEGRRWITARFSRGHDGVIEVSGQLAAVLASQFAVVGGQLSQDGALDQARESPVALGLRQEQARETVGRARLPPGQRPQSPGARLPPGATDHKEGSVLGKNPSSLTKLVAGHLGDPVAKVILDPSNTGARRKADQLLAEAAAALRTRRGAASSPRSSRTGRRRGPCATRPGSCSSAPATWPSGPGPPRPPATSPSPTVPASPPPPPTAPPWPLTWSPGARVPRRPVSTATSPSPPRRPGTRRSTPSKPSWNGWGRAWLGPWRLCDPARPPAQPRSRREPLGGHAALARGSALGHRGLHRRRLLQTGPRAHLRRHRRPQ